MSAPDGAAGRVAHARRLARAGALPELDRLAEHVARLLGAPSAQVSVISDVQTVVGGTGAGAHAVGIESPAADSLCTVTVGAAEPVRVDDATRDPRVADLSPVAGGGVGAYLGVPLLAHGHVVGALCVYGPEPRTWSDDEVRLLEVLAAPVVAQLELAALESEHDDERLVWQMAIDAGGVGAFDWDLVSGELRWDERLLRLFGLTAEEFGGTIEAFNACVHPDDRARVGRALAAAITTCGTYEAEYRVVHPDGTIRWVAARGRALPGPEGTTVRVLGVASDVTSAREEEASVTRVLEAMPAAYYHLDAQWRFTYVNARAEQMLGAIGRPIVGEVVWDLFPATVGTVFERSYRDAVAMQTPVTFEAYYPPPLDGWYEVRAWPVEDGLAVYFLDATQRREAQQTMARAAQRAELLREVTDALVDTLDPEDAMSRFAGLVVPALGDWCVVTLAEEAVGSGGPWRRGLRDVGWWHADPALRPDVRRYARLRLDALLDDSFVRHAVADGTTTAIETGATQRVAEVLAPGEAREVLLGLAPESAVVVPLSGRGRTSGVLTVFRDASRPGFTPAEVATLEEAAGRAGLALDNARLYAQQREVAETLQRSMMTAPPEPDHLQVAVRYTPAAETARVGGDWYDAFLQPGGATMVVIGDVVGHDTAAAAAMGQLRSILRGIAVTTNAGPAESLARLDEAIATLLIDTTATLVAARLEQSPQDHEAGVTHLRWSNAGHPPPLVASRDDAGDVRVEVMTAQRPDLLLGLSPSAERTESVASLRRGSTVLLYTDGLVERRDLPLEEGLTRLAAELADLEASGTDLESLCDALLARMTDERPEDDVALVAVRLHRQDGPRPPEAGPVVVPEVVPPHPRA
jgi:PAS domain S-box-containing protein